VLDDDAATRQITALVLARAGYSVDVAGDGESGWDAIHATSYDLLVTDNDMPRLTGLQLIGRMRCTGMALPVIMVSGSMELGQAQDDPWLALAALLNKPYTFANLIAAVRHAAPIAPDAGEGAVHCLEPKRDAAIPFPFPARTDTRPRTFAKTA
jgi:DNA-binding response OmpR family regulator